MQELPRYEVLRQIYHRKPYFYGRFSSNGWFATHWGNQNLEVLWQQVLLSTATHGIRDLVAWDDRVLFDSWRGLRDLVGVSMAEFRENLPPFRTGWFLSSQGLYAVLDNGWVLSDRELVCGDGFLTEMVDDPADLKTQLYETMLDTWFGERPRGFQNGDHVVYYAEKGEVYPGVLLQLLAGSDRFKRAGDGYRVDCGGFAYTWTLDRGRVIEVR